MKQNQNINFKAMLRNYILETAVYAVVAFLYYKFVLQFLAEPISNLFSENLSLYTGISIALILLQAFVLEIFISIIVNGLGLRWPNK